MPNIQLADNLRYLRKQHKLTQTTLSEMLNISRQAYSNYETSKRTPDLGALLHLAAFYQVSLDELVLVNLPGAASLSGSGSEAAIPPTFTSGKENDSAIRLTTEELDTVLRLRSLSVKDRRTVTGFLRSHSKVPD